MQMIYDPGTQRLGNQWSVIHQDDRTNDGEEMSVAIVRLKDLIPLLAVVRHALSDQLVRKHLLRASEWAASRRAPIIERSSRLTSVRLLPYVRRHC